MNAFYTPYPQGSAVPEERYTETHYSDDAYFDALAKRWESDNGSNDVS